MFERYIAYLKDNPKRYWFKRKLYGWGWTPVTWQGWLVILVFIGLIMLDFRYEDAASHSASDTLFGFVPHVIVLIIILIAICYRTGEKPQWQWGLPKNTRKD